MSALGEVDYVIAHGVYSWIPPDARGALLDHCDRALAPHGVAFVSFNAYPGSYLRDMARDILAYHLRGVTEPAQRLSSARELMEAIVSIESPSPYARVLREHLQRMLGAGEALLYHDDLAEVSTPFYLHEVIDHARAHGLQFLSEAELADSQMHEVPAAVGEMIARLPDDVVVREQYLDFLRNRMFRQTLLVRDTVEINRAIDDQVLEQMFIAAPLSRDGDRFVTDAGAELTTTDPFIAAGLEELSERWPAALSLDQLAERARQRVGTATTAADRDDLRNVLLQAHVARAARLLGAPVPVIAGDGADLPDRPRASPLARAQALAGRPVLSTLLPGNHIPADETERELITALDGTRDRPALAQAAGLSPTELDATLVHLARAGLLIA